MPPSRLFHFQLPVPGLLYSRFTKNDPLITVFLVVDEILYRGISVSRARLAYSNLAIKCIWWMTDVYNLTVSSERRKYLLCSRGRLLAGKPQVSAIYWLRNFMARKGWVLGVPSSIRQAAEFHLLSSMPRHRKPL